METPSIRPGQRASLAHDSHEVHITYAPDAAVDAWVFTARTLIRKDRVGDTIATWAVLLNVPAGLSGHALDGRDVDVEIAVEWQSPPVQRRTARVRCEAPPDMNFKILNFRMPLEDHVLAEGTLIVRQLP